MSTTDESDDDKFGILGDQTDFEARREPDWQWSTGRDDNSLVNKKAKKRFIIPGEKKQMKKASSSVHGIVRTLPRNSSTFICALPRR